MSEAIGIMNEAYFVGRHELIDWVNTLLKLNIQKVEECCTGAIHCQIFDVLYPGKVNMGKVNYEAKHEYEYVKNFKLLQDLFGRVDIHHYVPVDRIIKGKYQDNLELLQWVYEFFNRNYNGLEYDPVKRRAKSKGGSSAGAGAAKRPTSNAMATKFSSSLKTGAKRIVGKENTQIPTQEGSALTKNMPAREDAALGKAKKEIAELAIVLKELEKERDWYFSKILEVEKLCKNAPESPILQSILDVLYATDGDQPVAAISGEISV